MNADLLILNILHTGIRRHAGRRSSQVDYQHHDSHRDADDHQEAAQLGDAAHDRERQLHQLDSQAKR